MLKGWSILFFILALSIELIYCQTPIKLGKVKSSQLSEISGIVPYSYGENLFWVHNDSGDKSAIYLLDDHANLKATIEVTGVTFTDVEEIGRLKLNNKNYLVIADMGNNLRNREVLSMYIIAEPQIDIIEQSESITVPIWKVIRFSYADMPRDAEAFIIDPIDQHIYIFTKRDFKSTIFRLPISHPTDKIAVLSPIGNLPFTFTTAADIAIDGRHIMIKNLTSIYYWERNLNEDIITSLSKKYKKIQYIIEPQGEALCFDLNKRYFYTIYERALGLDAYLYKYKF